MTVDQVSAYPPVQGIVQPCIQSLLATYGTTQMQDHCTTCGAVEESPPEESPPDDQAPAKDTSGAATAGVTMGALVAMAALLY